MKKRQLIFILLLSFFIIFLSTGCAHRPVTPSQAVSEDLQEDQNGQITTGETEQMPSDSEMEDISDEDFFEEEFEEDKVYVADPLSPFRTGVKNFFRNITTPIRLVNCMLQAKGEAAAVEFSRFVVNTTIGVHLPLLIQKTLARPLATMALETGYTLCGRYWGRPHCVIQSEGPGTFFWIL